MRNSFFDDREIPNRFLEEQALERLVRVRQKLDTSWVVSGTPEETFQKNIEWINRTLAEKISD